MPPKKERGDNMQGWLVIATFIGLYGIAYHFMNKKSNAPIF